MRASCSCIRSASVNLCSRLGFKLGLKPHSTTKKIQEKLFALNSVHFNFSVWHGASFLLLLQLLIR